MPMRRARRLLIEGYLGRDEIKKKILAEMLINYRFDYILEDSKRKTLIN